MTYLFASLRGRREEEEEEEAVDPEEDDCVENAGDELANDTFSSPVVSSSGESENCSSSEVSAIGATGVL